MSSSADILHDEERVGQNNEIGSSRWTTNLFGVYSKVFKIMLAQWKETLDHVEEEERSRELDELVLPSNEEWRHQVYYRLVDLQREMDFSIAENEMESFDEHHQEDNKTIMNKSRQLLVPAKIKWDWEPLMMESTQEENVSSSEKYQKNLNSRENILKQLETAKGSIAEACVEPGWRLDDIILAAKVLMQGETTTKRLVYSDEAEMRRVFGLVYDVLRYKQILNQTLEDADFWIHHGDLRQRERIVWLLLYDMQGRKFTNNIQIAMIEAREKVFQAAGLQDIEQALLETKTKLAASISRLRIGGSALTLDQLLPAHLRYEGVSWSDEASVASGWVNTIKVPTKTEFITDMSKLGLELSLNWRKLKENNYAFDPVCPKVVVLHDKAREQLARSDLVREHRFVFLDRSLCLGAAALSKAIRVAHLCGPVILTHSVAPRHTGYLAGLLIDIEEAGRLLAFGAGRKREEYEKYLEELGINERQCRVFAENYPQAPGFAEMERATIILTIPPCSYTGLRDIVDLAVARGGDTELLESLTNIEDQAQFERPRTLLTKQISSLKYTLTRPNVQLLVYEAHSTLPSETFEMLHQAVEYVNKMAIDKYTSEHLPKKRTAKDLSPKSAGRSSRSGCQRTLEESRTKNSKEQEDEEDASMNSIAEIQVPDSDLFEIGDIFDLNSKNSEATDLMNEDGCYLAAVRRKEMMQFNSLFMIKVAESKGLFGDPNSTGRVHQEQSKEETTMSPKSKQKELLSKTAARGGMKKSIRLDRIAAPTHSSMLKVGSRATSRQSIDHGSSEAVSVASARHSCPRYSDRVARDERSMSFQVRESRRRDARRWWEQSANFLIHAARCESCKFRIFHTDPWTRRVLYPPRIQPIIFPDDPYPR